MHANNNLLESLDAVEIERLRSLARSRGLGKTIHEDFSIRAASREKALPLSYAQMRLWFLAHSRDISEIYHLPAALRLQGELDYKSLRRSLNTIFTRHEALRSIFVSVDGEPTVQLLPDEMRFPLEEIDLRGMPNADSRLIQLYDDQVHSPFDLSAGPLVRACLIRTEDRKHVLILTQHHIVSDGWSMGILVSELSALYSAYLREEPDPLPPLKIQYPDYAAWQREWLGGERLEDQIEHWRRALDGAPALLSLPTDRPRPQRQSFAGAHTSIRIDAELTQQLKELSARNGVTIFITLLAGWATVLSRLSGQKDLVIGSPVANRGHVQIEHLIGCFVNTLALRMDFSGDPDVAALLRSTRDVTLAAQDHQDLPFEQVVEIVKPPRSLAHTPVFQVLFSWQSEQRTAPSLPGLQVELFEPPYPVARFDLKLDLFETTSGISGSLIYSTALFDKPTIERHIRYFTTTLRAMAADSKQTISSIDLLAPEERRLLLETWNTTTSPYPRDTCVHQLFEEHVRVSPTATALVSGDAILSYAELNCRANQLAHHLIELGIRPDDRVAICMDRSPEMVIGLLAILKAGGAYVPLDPAYPSERLAQVLIDAAPLALLCDALGHAVLGSETTDAYVVLDLDLPQPRWSSKAETDPKVAGLTSHHLAYVIYTSGSTGTPKGVMVEHRSAMNFHQAMAATIYSGVSSPLRIGWNASFSFDMSLKGFLQLLSGHCLVIIPQQVRASGAEMMTFLRQQKIDAFDTTPSQLKVLIAEGLLEDPHPHTVLLGGEPIDAAMWAELSSSNTVTAYNMYGPTECTVDATITPITVADETPHIGRPIMNVRIYLLDSHSQPVPLGAVGEMYIGGAGVARGYLNRTELTTERFLVDPFSDEPGARMYKTGDLARYRPDGNLEFLGRNDQQVKIRGFRIELGEIEARLAEHPLATDAAVIVREDTPDDKRLVAYYTGDVSLTAEQLRSYLSALLPEYMMPAAFVHLEILPLTHNGKLDRKALPAPEGDAFANHAYEPPQGETEIVLADVWKDLLHVDRVGRNDNFFELGGHSLLAVQLLVRIRPLLGCELPITTLFAHPVLADLATSLKELSAEVNDLTSYIRRIPRKVQLPLSYSQQRLWFISQIEDVSITYHIPVAIHLRGDIDTNALSRSLNTIFARHEALRSTFVTFNGEAVVQLLPEAMGLPLSEIDLSDEPNAHEKLIDLHEQQVRLPFDLSRGPMVRASLVNLGNREHVLILIQHHIVSDGWSLGIFCRELTTLYTAYLNGKPNPLPPLEIQYPDYAAWQRDWLTGKRLETQIDYWKKALANTPPLLDLPTDRPRPPQQSFTAAQVAVHIDAELTQALKTLSAKHGATLFMTLLTAWAAVLSRLSGQDDLVIGTPVANRRHVQVENLIGFFVNTLALRIDLSGQPTVEELLHRVRAATLEAQDHQDLPFEQVVEIVNPPRRLDHTPIFQVMLVWQNDERDLPQLAETETEPLADSHERIKFDLRLGLYEQQGEILGKLSYSTALFDEETIQRHIGYLQKVLHEIVQNSQQQMAGIDLLTAEERTLLLETWNATAAPYSSRLCMQELFEQQVSQTPDAVALRFENQTISYTDLNCRANRLAHHLIELGVVPTDRIAVCMERGPSMIIGILAILKAGGAYVPLDLTFPTERLIQILADASARLVLCDEAGGRALGSPTFQAYPLLDIEQTEANVAGKLDSNIDPASIGLTSNDLAYVIYTSGSTGTPKGVMGLHRPVINLIEWVNERFCVGGNDTLLFTTSLSFDLSVYDIFGMLAAGGCIRIASKIEMLDPASLSRLMFERGVTFWDSAPAVFHQLLPYLEDAAHCSGTSSLRLAFFSGDWVPLSFFDVFRRFFPDCQMIALGGATEATVWSNYYQVHRIAPEWQSIPYGKPIQNARYYVLDERLNPLPLGSRGHLYIGGECLTAGYLNRPALTAERFVSDPFSSASNAFLYKTGDMARYMRDGNLEFLGRSDHQIKIRGFRVELGEIESNLSQHNLVRDAVVIVREDIPGDKRLVAYVVRNEDQHSDDVKQESMGAEFARSLRTFLAARLPEYMIPAAFVELDAFPLTSSGKLDRKSLIEPGHDAYIQRQYEPPQNDKEEALAEIWQDMLHVERVGRNDHFFELGGHSLLVVQLMERLRRRNLELEIRAIFTAPILSELASAMVELEEIRL